MQLWHVLCGQIDYKYVECRYRLHGVESFLQLSIALEQLIGLVHRCTGSDRASRTLCRALNGHAWTPKLSLYTAVHPIRVDSVPSETQHFP